jgi:hypothetical protein
VTEVTYVNWSPSGDTDLLHIEGVWNDVFEARQFIKSAISAYKKRGEGLTLVEPLTIAALIKYFRPFGGGRRPKKLRPSILPPELHSAHIRLKAIRDWHFAHPINEFEVHNVTVSVRDLGTPLASVTSVSSSTTMNSGLSPADESNLIQLCDFWLDSLLPERNAATDKLLSEAKNLSPSLLNGLSAAESVQPNDDPFIQRGKLSRR